MPSDSIEPRTAQEEALWRVLEMMKKDCEDQVDEFDNELNRVKEELGMRGPKQRHRTRQKWRTK